MSGPGLAGKSSPRAWWPRMRWHDRAAVAILLLVAGVIGVGMLHTRSLAETAKKEVAAEAPTVVTPSVHAHRVIAYYFHTTYRCASCRAIEAYSHEAIESAFADEIKDGRLVWKVVNIEVKGNEHFVKDYGLFTKSLVLVNEVRGKPAQWKNLADVWKLLQEKPKFLRYVQDEMRGYLTERS
jgi:hypothetical protein